MVNFDHKTAPISTKWNPYDSLDQQVPNSQTSWQIQKEGILINEGEQAIRTYSVRREPDYWSLHAMGELIGDQFRETMQIKCPFLIHFGVHIPEQNSIKTKIQSRESLVELFDR